MVRASARIKKTNKKQKMIKNRAYVLIPRLADHILDQYHTYEVSDYMP